MAKAPAKPFDLDALEREGSKQPFVAVIGGHEIHFSDPQDQAWQDLVGMSQTDPMRFFRLVVNEPDQEAFFETKTPAWKLQKLMVAYMEHYGLPMPGELTASLNT